MVLVSLISPSSQWRPPNQQPRQSFPRLARKWLFRQRNQFLMFDLPLRRKARMFFRHLHDQQ
jgi:hypothetical protein